MAQTVKLKRSATPSAIPTTGQLDLGEVAINTYDGKMFIKKDNGTASIVEIGAGGSLSLDNLTDVTITTPSTDQVLKYNGSAWVNGPSAGGSISYFKDPVKVATTANGTLSSSFANGSVIDGITLATNDRILIKNQSNASENGIYVVNASGAPTRSTDCDSNSEVIRGTTVYVQFGIVNGGNRFQLVSSNGNAIIVGTSTQVWIPLNGILIRALNTITTSPTMNGDGGIAIIGGSAPTVAQSAIAIAAGGTVTAGTTGSIAIGYDARVSATGSSGGIVLGNFNIRDYNSECIAISTYGTSGSFSTQASSTARSKCIAIGQLTTATNTTYSTACTSIGYNNRIEANINCGAILGYGGKLEYNSEITFSGGTFSGTGDAKSSIIIARLVTTDQTQTQMRVSDYNTTDSTAPAGYITLVNDSTYIFDCDIVARNTTTDTESKAWNLKFAIRRGTSAANTAIIGSATKTVIGEDTGTSSWDIAASTDTTNGRPLIYATGEASKTIRWVANIRLTKVTG